MAEQGELFEVAKRARPKCWVYLIGTPGRSVAKIGIAQDTAQRLRSLQTSTYERLAVLWRTPGGRELEIDLHEHFSDRHVSGEWFDFGEEDPVTCVREAVKKITGRVWIEPPPALAISRVTKILGVPVDQARPPESDPDRDDPLYQVEECGCRQLTPTECMAIGCPADSVVTMPVAPAEPGTLPCGGRH